MRVDLYTRAVLTVIAFALVYLCIVLTPLPTLNAQGAQRPGVSTAPGEMVIVGWRTPPTDRVPVQLVESIPLKMSGDVRVSNEIRVGGTVQTQQSRDAIDRVMLTGWEDRSRGAAVQRTFDPAVRDQYGLPVRTYR